MGENHIGTQIALFLLLAIGVALLATLIALVILIVASIAPRLSRLIPRSGQRAKRLKEGPHELDDLREKQFSKP